MKIEILDQDMGCCGTNLKNDNISFFGVFTFVFPLYFFLKIILIFSWPIRKMKLIKLAKFIILKNSCYQLVVEIPIFPKLKCLVTAKLIKYSPYFAGKFFQKFNFIIMSSLVILMSLALKCL